MDNDIKIVYLDRAYTILQKDIKAVANCNNVDRSRTTYFFNKKFHREYKLCQKKRQRFCCLKHFIVTKMKESRHEHVNQLLQMEKSKEFKIEHEKCAHCNISALNLSSQMTS